MSIGLLEWIIAVVAGTSLLGGAGLMMIVMLANRKQPIPDALPELDDTTRAPRAHGGFSQGASDQAQDAHG